MSSEMPIYQFSSRVIALFIIIISIITMELDKRTLRLSNELSLWLHVEIALVLPASVATIAFSRFHECTNTPVSQQMKNSSSISFLGSMQVTSIQSSNYLLVL